jgi:hypothetical protein
MIIAAPNDGAPEVRVLRRSGDRPGGIVVTRPQDGFGLCLTAARKRGWPGQLGHPELDLWARSPLESEGEMSTERDETREETLVRKVDELIRINSCLVERVERVLRLVEVRRRRVVLFAYFTGEDGMSNQIVAPNVVSTLAFGLIGNTPTGDTFAEPTAVVTPSNAGTVSLEPSVQGEATATGTPFTTAGTFTATAGYLGPVTLSADVNGVDNEDATFNVIEPPETVAYDATKFVAN